MVRIFILGFTLLLSLPTTAQECVVLLHGLAKSERDMRKIERRLTNEGFKTINKDYKSTRDSIAKLSSKVVKSAINSCGEFSKVHFVTHSMGGILVRHYLLHHKIDRLGRIVMLGPPNQGSEVVDYYRDVPGFKLIGGPAGLQLGTGTSSAPKQLGEVDFDLGVIAGTRSINPILSYILPGEDDGKVTIESTKVIGMNDHISMPVTHPFMMKSGDVIEQVIHYIKVGRFSD